MSRLDLLMLAMVSIWGANFSVVKVAIRSFPELAFNALRLAIAAAVILAALAWQRPPAPARLKLTPAEWGRLLVLGVVGHTLYQLLFLAGVKRTSVANASLILGTTPVVVALLTAWTGQERVSPIRWLGAAVSFAGLGIVVGRNVEWTASGHLGDALMLGSTLCWATYSVASVPLLRRHSPLLVTGLSMTVGAVLYAAATLPWLLQVPWTAIPPGSWALMVASAVFALAVAYLIWYTSVQRAGSTRTAAWSNLTPVVAMAIAAVWVGEPVGWSQVAGAATILTGLALTRRG